MIKGRTSIESLVGLGREITEAVEEAAVEVAREMPHWITEHIRNGESPDGQPFPDNAPSTLRSKERAGQGPTPGVATGTLSDERAWRVDVRGRETEVRPPPEREDIIDYLEARGYEVLGVPEETPEQLDNAIARSLDKVR